MTTNGRIERQSRPWLVGPRHHLEPVVVRADVRELVAGVDQVRHDPSLGEVIESVDAAHAVDDAVRVL